MSTAQLLDQINQLKSLVGELKSLDTPGNYASNGVLFGGASGKATTSTGFIWEEVSDRLVVSGYVLASGAGGLPAYGVIGFAYDSAAPRGLLVSIDNGVYKPLHIESSDLRLRYQTTTRITIDSVGLSFFGVATVARQVGGAATADLTWSANEVAMVNTLWTMARNYGLLT